MAISHIAFLISIEDIVELIVVEVKEGAVSHPEEGRAVQGNENTHLILGAAL